MNNTENASELIQQGASAYRLPLYHGSEVTE